MTARIKSVIDDLHYWKEYFNKKKNLDIIDAQEEKTLEWMRKNTESFTVEGHVNKGEPWWPMPSFSDDAVLIEGRSQMIRDRAYEHGILHFMFGLVDQGIVKFSPDSDAAKVLTQATTPKVINQLVMLSRGNLPFSSITLAQLAAFYCYSSTVNGSKVRDRYLSRLAPLGILSAYVNGGYDIELGPVAKAFHNNVYFKIIQETPINPDEKSK